MGYSFLYTLPIWASWLIFLVILALSVELGFRIGLRKRKQWPDADVGGGSVVLTSTLALLGLILAFTYSASASRLDARKQAVLMEANALGTAFLRAGLAAEPERTQLRQALLDYARTRLIDDSSAGALYQEANFKRVVNRQLVAQARLWPITEAAVEKGGRGPVETALMIAVNEVIDMHTVRMHAVVDLLPGIVIGMLIFIAGVALAVTGYNAGLSGVIGRGRLSLFALVLSSVMYIIVDFDRPRDGFIRVKQMSMEGLVRDMENSLGGVTGASSP